MDVDRTCSQKTGVTSCVTKFICKIKGICKIDQMSLSQAVYGAVLLQPESQSNL